MKRVLLFGFVVACGTSGSETADLGPPVAGRQHRPTPEARATAGVNPRLLRRFKPLQTTFGANDAPDPAQVALGRMLYFDPRLSRDRDVSCNTCHPLDHYGVDHAATSTGFKGQKGRRNAPSAYNTAGQASQFWDGRAANLNDQAGGPILNPIEMAMPSINDAVLAIRAVPGYAPLFRAAFPSDPAPITFEHLTASIGAFERTLITPSRWDRFLFGDAKALTPKEIEGVKLFADLGCVSCHTGALLGGSMLQQTGIVVPWPNQKDQGRYEITHQDADKMWFKVPSLRNVAETAPYFHDGSVAKLDDAVRMMGHHQLGLELSDADVNSIVVWLGSLTGDIPKAMQETPTLPPDE